MTEKAIIILDGNSFGKNLFQETIKDAGYWVWNFNHMNLVFAALQKMGYEGEKDERYHSYAEKLEDLGNEFFNFETTSTVAMIEKFMKDKRADVLIIHNCSGKLAVELQDFYQNAFDILVTEYQDVVDNNQDYCKALNPKDEDFVEKTLSVIRILTK